MRSALVANNTNVTDPMSVKTKSKCTSSLTRSKFEWIKLISTILVPLMIGVFTIVTTVQQIQTDGQNRLKDIQIAYDQRQHDLFLASESRREYLFDKYLNDVSYYVQLGENRSSTDKITIHSKTLAVFRQMDPRRKGDVIRSLLEQKLIYWQSNDQFDMSDSDLSYTEFDQMVTLDGLRLENLRLNNVKFINLHLRNCVFRNSILTGSNFTNSIITEIDFRNTELDHTDFTHTTITHTDFTSANLNRSNIRVDDEAGNIFDFIILPNGTYKLNNKKPIIKNGGGESEIHGWLIKHGEIVSINYHAENSKLKINDTAKYGDHYFSQKISNDEDDGAVIVQYIQLDNYYRLIKNEHAEYHLSAWLGGVTYREDYATIKWSFEPVMLSEDHGML
ncbi:unnamed protein product, partial [Didymodactylos carnosus]